MIIWIYFIFMGFNHNMKYRWSYIHLKCCIDGEYS